MKLLSSTASFRQDGKYGELELLTGLVREDADTAGSLARRFQINYDTRSPHRASHMEYT